MTLRNRLLLLVAAAAMLLSTACSEALSATTTPAAAPQAAAAAGDARVNDAALDAVRLEWLDLAFAAATAVPVDPHIKTRSRLQEQVLATCLELGLPRRAYTQAAQIADWRRGLVYADYAAWCAERGLTDDVEQALALARDVAATEPTALAQPWRRDRIRARLAAAYLWLGDDGEAVALQQDLVDTEMSHTAAVMAQQLAEADFDAKLAELDALLVGAGLDLARSVLESEARLYARFYADPLRRAALQQRVLESFPTLPLELRLELLLDLADVALARGDAAVAFELVERATALRDSVDWLPEQGVAWKGRLAAVRFRAGDADGARAELAAARADYAASRLRIADIWRAGALRPVAEAYATMGDLDTARAIWMQALDEGCVNPNSVPRAEDLVATCLSLVAMDVAPDEALQARMLEIQAGLGDPW